jgi:RND superfamily putative drug exporter
MFTALGHLTVRRRRLVLALSALLLVLSAVLGTGVFDRLSGGGFDDPSSESSRVDDRLADEFDSGSPNLLLLVDADDSVDVADGVPAVDDPRVAAAGTELVDRLSGDDDVVELVSYWTLDNAPPLRSDDGRSALIAVRLAGDEDRVGEASERIEATLPDVDGPITVSAAGQAPVFGAVSATIEGDLKQAESVAIPITLVLLVLVFGGLVAAGLPLLVGAVAVLGTFFTLWIITQFTDVSVFSINLVTALGLGLAIDYSLFIVSRFREELEARPAHPERSEDRQLVDAAVVRTVETAGRTVLVSAVTVAISLSALLVFPLYFLRSFAFAGIGVTLVAAVASVVALPAVLSMLGRRVDALRVLGRRRPAARVGAGFWARTARAVMRRPVAVSVVVVGFLLFLGAPFLNVVFGTPDQRVLPVDDPARVATERLGEEFSSDEAWAFPVLVDPAEGLALSDEDVDGFAVELSVLEGVGRVDAPTGRYIGGQLVLGPDGSLDGYRAGEVVRFGVVPTEEPISVRGEELVRTVRALDAPADAELLVGGAAAQLIDSKAAITARLPYAVGIIMVATFVLLFLMFGSVLVPIKAIVLNVLSLTATFGAMVWVFQEGNGAGLLGFTATGMTDTTTPILMFCIAFGLSMDYEVFLLSRIKEEYDRTGDNSASVAIGLERTGRIVTAAAALLAVTFIAFATSDITFIKLFGLGLALAVLMDATLVRATLVPAFMQLAGDANWWAPGWMRRLHDRFGFSEHAPGSDDVEPGVDAADAEPAELPDEPVPVGAPIR